MGFLEAAVVVYLRLIYYPGGFDFPLIKLPVAPALIELGREAATIVMLWCVAMLTGRTGWGRFAWLAILFGTWDLVYYAALKLLLNWPPSFLTWDILFLIPLIWVGPVLAPLIISLLLIATGLLILVHETRRIRLHLVGLDWPLLLVALALCLYSFMANHAVVYGGGVPAHFPWPAFTAGVMIGCGVLVKAVRFNPRGKLPRRYGLR